LKLLQVLPLRETGPLVESFEWPIVATEDPPRALKSLARIVDGDLCHRCGTCVGICPTAALGVDEEGYPIVSNLSACTDCDLCVKVCPGSDFDVKTVAQQMFGFVPQLTDMHGQFTESYLAHASDPALRERSTSGGLVTAVLLSLLRRGLIDGAVVIVSDEKDLWKGKPVIARTEAEIIESSKSRYAISPTNSVFSEIIDTPGRYALVGLPCQIHGFHNAAKLNKRLQDRIVVTIGLFCHAAVEHDPMKYIWSSIDEETKAHATKFVSRIGKHPGTPYVFRDDGKATPVYFPKAKGYRPSSIEMINILYRLYTPPRCLTCYDSTSEFADIAVGDPWMAPPSDDVNFKDGYSFTLARTPRAKELLAEAAAVGDITLLRLKDDHARTSNTLMGVEKRWRAFRIIETRRRQGHAIPNYGFEIPRVSGKHLLLTEINILSHIFCFIKGARLSVLKFVLSPTGYSLLWLNNKKRRFRDWRRDKITSLRRRFSSK